MQKPHLKGWDSPNTYHLDIEKEQFEMKSMITSINHLIEDEKNWVVNGADSVYKISIKDINNILDKNSTEGFYSLSSDFESLSHVYSSRGIVSILNDIVIGWHEIFKSILYEYKYIEFLFFKTFFDIDTFAYSMSVDDRFFIESANLLSALIVYEMDDMLQILATRIQILYQLPQLVPKEFRNKRNYEPFIFKLYALYGTEKLDPTVVRYNLGIYSDVFIYWDDPDQLATVLIKLCDYHCTKMYYDGGFRVPEFYQSPFCLIPFDILAIYKLRDRLGLPTPRINHPLMNSPLVKFYPPKYDYTDDIIERYQKRIEEYFPQEIRDIGNNPNQIIKI